MAVQSSSPYGPIRGSDQSANTAATRSVAERRRQGEDDASSQNAAIAMGMDELIAARQYWTELGYLEDSGERRPDRTGKTQPGYRVSILGHLAHVYRNRGFTLEQAMALAKGNSLN
jgi:hypothetical protein